MLIWIHSLSKRVNYEFHKVQADVLAGLRTIPTIEELLAELPKLEV